jgi:transposase
MSCECDLCVSPVRVVAADRPAVVVLEQRETTVVRGRVAHDPVRRATLEEALLAAYAEGDRERVSRLRADLLQLKKETEAWARSPPASQAASHSSVFARMATPPRARWVSKLSHASDRSS